MPQGANINIDHKKSISPKRVLQTEPLSGYAFYNVSIVRFYLLLFFSSSAIFIALTFNGRPNRVINPEAS
mgnify:CR=1 FL=1